MTEPSSYIQPALIIAVLWGMLRFMVVNELHRITRALGSHEKRIRRQEETLAYLRGKGCLTHDSCPMGGDDLDEDEQP